MEEVEEVKKEIALLSSRIDATKRKLVLESKLRDAAQSITRLESPSGRESFRDGFGKSPKGHRRSIMGSKGSMNELLGKHDEELSASSRKCEDLAQELWRLEKRAQGLQRKLLEHTAGVLQMTHTGFLKPEPLPQSPDGLSTYIDGRDSETNIDLIHDFDDGSFYQALDLLLQVRDGSEEEKEDLHNQFAMQNQYIQDTGRKLEDLNRRLENSIDQAHSGDRTLPEFYSGGNKDPEASGAIVLQHLNLLERGLDALRDHRDSAVADARQLTSKATAHQQKVSQYDDILQSLWAMMLSGDGDARVNQSRNSSDSDNSIKSPVPHEEFSLQAFSSKLQSLFARAMHLTEQKDILTRQIQQQRELNGKSDAQKDAQISELTLGLEQSRLAAETKEREAKETRDELVLVTERLDSARQEATLLEQQHSMTKRNALEAEKQARSETEEHLFGEIEAKQDQLRKIEAELANLKDDSGIAEATLRAELEDSEKRLQQSITLVEAAKGEKAHRDAVELSLKQQLDAKIGEAEKTHIELETIEGKMIRLQTELTVAKAELDGAYGTRAQRAAEVASNPAMQRELDEAAERNSSLLDEISELKTQQEALNSANSELSQRAQTLQRELTEIIGEYEIITKVSIDFEREREALETSLDSLRDRCEELESQLGEERVQQLGVKNAGATTQKDSAVSVPTSTTVLRNEFKKMMREMRAENMKALRVRQLLKVLSSPPYWFLIFFSSNDIVLTRFHPQFEQEERRKLESLVRSLKRDQTPGKSSLNQSTTVH